VSPEWTHPNRKEPVMRGLMVLVSMWMVCLPGLVSGMTCPEADHAANRAAFVQAERSPPRGRGEWERLRRTLGAHPLFPYVELARLRVGWPRVPRSEVEAFLGDNRGEPVTFRLRGQWLRRLAERREWSKFTEWYPEDASVELQCLHARARLETGDRLGALSEAEALWMSGESRPKACDPVFEAWLESDRFTPAAAWDRTELAMARGRVRLARYLEQFLEPDDRRLAAAWRTIHENPQRVGTTRLDGDPSKVEGVLSHGLERLARFNPEAAVEALTAVEKRTGLGAEARAGVARRIGLSFATEHDARAIEWLQSVDAAYADNLVLRWRVAAAALHSQWDAVIEGISAMPDSERTRERWRFWRAQALEAVGQFDEAREAFESLAQERDYYGFLAADRLGMPYRFNHRRLEIAPATIERVATMPAVQRALELYALERRVDARREWNALIPGLDEEELKAAAWIAGCNDWHGRAILTIVRTPDRDDLELRFPVAYREFVESAARRRDLPPATVYAIIRQESAFIADARSPAGALGLMQIMPRTGRMLMREAGRTWRGRGQLLAPDLNVALGARYVRSLLGKTDGNFVLAAASYNAGPQRVKRWLPENGDVDAALWIDNIPFAETRRYVRRFLAYGAIYEHRLGQTPSRLSERMPPIPARADS